MKKLLILTSLLTSYAFAAPSKNAADTTVVDIGGMHCSECKDHVKTAVCDDAKLKTAFASCTVKWVSKKKKTGQLVIVAKKDTVVDVEGIKAAIKAEDADLTVDIKESR